MTDQGEMVESGFDVMSKEKDGPDKTALSESEKYWNALNIPLQAYLKNVKRHPLLTKEEELEAFKKYRNFGDQEAKNLLIVSNLRLVLKIALAYGRRSRFPAIDLIQEGNLGLIRAVEKYDPYREAKFSYYASFWIKAFILKYIMDNWNLVKLITTEKKRKLFSQLNKEKRKLAKLGVDPDNEQLAENLEVEAEDVLDMQNFASGEVSLDQPLSSEEGSSPRIDFMSSKIDIEKIVSDNDLKNKGRALFERFREILPKRERIIFDNRICCEEATTLQELGDKLGLSRERTRQIEKELYNKLYKFKKEEEAMAAQKAAELNGVTLSEVEAVTKKNSKAREVALLHFGLKDGKGRLSVKEIIEETGCPKTSVPSFISQVKSRIRNLREKKEQGKKESADPPPEQNKRTEPGPSPNPSKADPNPIPHQENKNPDPAPKPQKEPEQTGGKTSPDREKGDNPGKNDSDEPIHLLIKRGSKRFEMTIPGGPLYDLLVRYSGL